MEVKVALGESVLMQISSGRQRQCSVAGGMHTRQAGSSLKLIGNIIVGHNLPPLCWNRVNAATKRCPHVPICSGIPANGARHAAGTWRRLVCLSKPRACGNPGLPGTLPGLTGTVKNNPVSYHYSSATPMHFQFEQMQFQLQL